MFIRASRVHAGSFRPVPQVIYITAFRGSSRLFSTPTDIPIPNKSKVWDSADEAVKDIKSGAVLLCGGKSQVVASSKQKSYSNVL